MAELISESGTIAAVKREDVSLIVTFNPLSSDSIAYPSPVKTFTPKLELGFKDFGFQIPNIEKATICPI